MNASEALDELKAGNERYLLSQKDHAVLRADLRHHQFLPKQKPFAIILGCSDSRVPAEIIFDRGFGDLFVIRVAGNVVAPSQIGSVEFACQQFATQLLVVLGHTNCGAIEATVNALIEGPVQVSSNIAAIVDRIAPAVRPLIDAGSSDRTALYGEATRANIEQSIDLLDNRSSIIRSLIEQQLLTIVGAEYSLETGKVDFYT